MWKTVKLSDLFKVGSSRRVLKSDWRSQGVPFYRGREITRLSLEGSVENELFITEDLYKSLATKSGVPRAGDILITAIGTIGNTYVVKNKDRFYFKDASVLWLSKTADVSSEYVQHWLRTSDFFEQLDEGNGATVDTLTIKKMASISLPLPPLAEQKRIVERLDRAFAEIDKGIATAEAKEGEIERLKAATLSAMLNCGSQSGESITGDEEDSVMWETVRLGDVCEIQPKKAQVKAKLAWEDEVSFMPMDELAIGQLYPVTTMKRRLKDVYSSYTYFEDGNILLAKITPCFENGKLGVASNLANGVGFGSSEYLVIRCRERVLAEYLYYHLSQSSFRAEGKKHMRGAVGHKRVPRGFVENFTFQLPPLAEQKRIVERLDNAFAEMEIVGGKTQSCVENYSALKASILKQELTPSEAV